VQARRRATIEEALDHAEAIVAEQGAGAVSVSEIARRLGMRAPSLYKYFPSLHAIYDALFKRGNEQIAAYLDDAVRGASPGLDRLRVSARAAVEWSVREHGLAALLYWRPVPGFEPSAESFAPSQAMWQRFRDDLTIAASKGQLSSAADSDDALRLLSIVVAGICSQQMANEPDASFAEGAFTSLGDAAFDMWAGHYSVA
jgi:AcrR family transcriptional regulator